ncbi:MAG: DUF1624 domain-containing protein, partial [Pseudorhodobacter sp.]|nr:DUF1624 domain-containing protein [Pseudorhodobacter sp.]
MVIYHFTFDLGMFGYIGPATAVSGFWALFARVVAGSFMALAGFSLFLAHPVSVNWPKYTRRLAVLVGCAALITVATYFVMPREFIFFGILHSIALASVLGLVFLRLTWWGTFIAGATIFALPQLYRSPAFDVPWLYWTGLGPNF